MSEAEDDTNHQLRMFWDVDTFGIRVDETPMYCHSEQRPILYSRSTAYRKKHNLTEYVVGLETSHRQKRVGVHSLNGYEQGF